MKVAAIAVATLDGMVAENYARALRLGQLALAGKPDVILFPEAFAAGYCGTDLAPYAEAPNSPYQRQFRELSRAGNCLVVVGYLERITGGVRNVAAVYDRGELLGTHAKRSLWVDRERPYRDEPALLQPGTALEVFPTRLGRLAVLICYENMLAANWDEVAGRADFVLSPYNCQGDPAGNNVTNAKRLGLPSAWADRTGTVYAGPAGWLPNPGTAGLVAADGRMLAKSDPGVEAIVTGELPVTQRPARPKRRPSRTER